jgi:putative SOS response-associated peptidase YedK
LKIIAEIERKLKDDPDGIHIKQGEIFPTDIVPAIANSKMHTVEPFAMKWGFSRFDGSKVVINARSETAMEKAMFRQPMMERRCLIPASNYFEWQAVDGKKVKHAIRDPESPLLYMAGCYRWEKDSKLPLFVILTRDAAPGLKYIHSRMPVILPGESREAWLSGTADITGVLNTAMGELTALAV